MTRGTLRTILIVAGACALSACASAPGTLQGIGLAPEQTLEQADTAASLAYAATATAVNVYVGANAADAVAVARGQALKSQAWALLQQERDLYAKGQSVAALLGQLQALEAQAKAL